MKGIPGEDMSKLGPSRQRAVSGQHAAGLTLDAGVQLCLAAALQPNSFLVTDACCTAMPAAGTALWDAQLGHSRTTTIAPHPVLVPTLSVPL